MSNRLTKRAGRNATYRIERILEIIDKLTDIENKEQCCLDVLPPCYQERLTIGTLNGNSASANKNNKLFILENMIEAGALVSTEWHNEQVMSNSNTNITLPVKPGTELHFLCTTNSDGKFVYNIISSICWRYIITSTGDLFINETLHDSSFEYDYDYIINETVFVNKADAIKALEQHTKNL